MGSPEDEAERPADETLSPWEFSLAFADWGDMGVGAPALENTSVSLYGGGGASSWERAVPRPERSGSGVMLCWPVPFYGAAVLSPDSYAVSLGPAAYSTTVGFQEASRELMADGP